MNRKFSTDSNAFCLPKQSHSQANGHAEDLFPHGRRKQSLLASEVGDSPRMPPIKQSRLSEMFASRSAQSPVSESKFNPLNPSPSSSKSPQIGLMEPPKTPSPSLEPQQLMNFDMQAQSVPSESFAYSLGVPANDPDDIIAELSQSEGRIGAVRRPITRRGNLFPKSKAHLRVALQLKGETTVFPELEVASEAALHRLSQSSPSAHPPFKHPWSSPTGNNGNGAPHPTPSGKLPCRNRFPEEAIEEDEMLSTSYKSSKNAFPMGVAGKIQEDSSSSDDDMDMAISTNDYDDEVLGLELEEEPEDSSAGRKRRLSSIWSLRDGGRINSTNSPGSGSEKTSQSGKMELDNNSPLTPSTLSFAVTQGRTGKRKYLSDGNDRFDPYAASYANSCFKRRAVSPSPSLASVTHSPVTSTSHHPILQPLASPIYPNLPLAHMRNPTPPGSQPIPMTHSASTRSATSSPIISSTVPYHAHPGSFFSSIHNAANPSKSRAVSPSSLGSSHGAWRVTPGSALGLSGVVNGGGKEFGKMSLGDE